MSWSLRPAIVAALAVAACTSCGAGRAATAALPGPTAGGAPPTAQATTTVPATVTTGAAPAPPATSAAGGDPGLLPQTGAVPVKDGQFLAEMAMFWQAVTTGQVPLAMSAFFPETAYVQLKALRDDAADWTDRLLAHFELDIQAARHLLGPDAAMAQLVSVDVGPARWISPGACYNRLGYWNSLNSRVVYTIHGVVYSFGIAALDGWRGEWYIIHLGSESPPAGAGVVDAPQAGPGLPGGGRGC